jgi:hypothetical protein
MVMVADTTIGPYAAAAIGAFGAVVGGVLTAGSSFLIERSRTTRDSEAMAREGRRAARLVVEELTRIERTLVRAAESGLTWPRSRDLPRNQWRTYRGVLASHTGEEAWRLVAAAYELADDANWRAAVFRQKSGAGDEEGGRPGENEWLLRPFQVVNEAIAVLESELGLKARVFEYPGYASVEELVAKIWGDAAQHGR